MSIMLKRRNYLWIQLCVAVVIVACSTITPFDQKAYDQSTAIKLEALSLMDKATDLYTSHIEDVTALRNNLSKAYEAAKLRSKNELSIKQWEIITDPKRNSIEGFLQFWEKKDKLSQEFINEAKIRISEHFDSVIQLEAAKNK